MTAPGGGQGKPLTGVQVNQTSLLPLPGSSCSQVHSENPADKSAAAPGARNTSLLPDLAMPAKHGTSMQQCGWRQLWLPLVMLLRRAHSRVGRMGASVGGCWGTPGRLC